MYRFSALVARVLVFGALAAFSSTAVRAESGSTTHQEQSSTVYVSGSEDSQVHVSSNSSSSSQVGPDSSPSTADDSTSRSAEPTGGPEKSDLDQMSSGADQPAAPDVSNLPADPAILQLPPVSASSNYPQANLPKIDLIEIIRNMPAAQQPAEASQGQPSPASVPTDGLSGLNSLTKNITVPIAVGLASLPQGLQLAIFLVLATLFVITSTTRFSSFTDFLSRSGFWHAARSEALPVILSTFATPKKMSLYKPNQLYAGPSFYGVRNKNLLSIL